jgi:hypothetical protein
MARTSSFSSTTPTSESNIAFFAAGGHNHDGQNSSLIDASKYSIFDFDQGLIPTNSERAQAQQRNKINFEDNIRDLLRTAGIELSANSINATQIIAGSITSEEIAANTITTNNLVSDILQSSNYSYTSGVFSDSGTFIDLSDGSIYSTNFAIDSSGNAYFTGDITGSSGTFSGIVSGGSVAGGTIDIGGADATSFHVDSSGNMWLGNAAYASAPFKVSSGGSLVASSVAITGGTLDIGGSDATSFHVASNGAHWAGSSAYSTAPFRVSSSGALTATSATITGAINATSGTFSGNITSSATISGGTLTGTTITGSTLSAGNPSGNGVDITSTEVRINTTGAGGASAKLVFNTNAGSGTNQIYSDKQIQIASGGSGGRTFVTIGTTSGGSVGPVSLTCSSFNSTGPKNFVIQHPLYENKLLVHAAIEGPSVDVFYRGNATLANGEASVQLPDYFEVLCKSGNRTVIITPKLSDLGTICHMAASSVLNGQFSVKCQSCLEACSHQFDWLVIAERKADIEVEPLKSDFSMNLGNSLPDEV